MEYLSDGNRLITIQRDDGRLVTALFPPNIYTQTSQDENNHACIIERPDGINVPRCLYLKTDA